MNLRIKVSEIQQIENDLVSDGYTKIEAIQIIQAAAICKLADCTDKSYSSQAFIRVGGGITTHEQ